MGFEGSRTIGVDLWGGQARGHVPNARTCIARAVKTPPVKRPLRELFMAAYPQFADRCRAVDEPGVAIIAVHEATGRAQGLCTLRARVERFVAAIIGRHDRCDLFLEANEALALRHLAVIVDPVKSWKPGDPARYRVLDLRTDDGFRDEQDRKLRGLACDGPALLRCAGYALFLLPLGDPTDWPQCADGAWDQLPERVYTDEIERWPDSSSPRPRPERIERFGDRRTTTLTRTSGVHDSHVDLVRGGVAAGVFELWGKRHGGKLRVGHDELRDGVLLGRYERCHAAPFADDASISRVHALLIQIGDTILVVDTASTNGTRLAGDANTRVIPVTGDVELELGKHTRARWQFVS